MKVSWCAGAVWVTVGVGHVPTSLETCKPVRILFLPFVGYIMSCFMGGGIDNEDVTCLMAKECPVSELELIISSATEHMKGYGLEILPKSLNLQRLLIFPNVSQSLYKGLQADTGTTLTCPSHGTRYWLEHGAGKGKLVELF